ncbi:MAG: glycosyltransferase family 39 protein [Chloroflexota bacterium]
MSQIAVRPSELPPLGDRPVSGVDDAARAPMSSAFARGRAWSKAHPDLVALSVVLLVGLLFRLALLYRIPPLFMPGDSQSFLTPAFDLARGLGFDPILKRPLGYPLLLAIVISALGEDLRGLVFVQATIGLATVAATYGLGRLAFGRAAGVLAALSVAIGGQIAIYEHYVLAESIFAAWLAGGLLALVASVRSGGGSWRLAATGGALLALASLFRPIAEVIVPILPVFFLATVRPRRSALALTVAAVVGFVCALAPGFAADVVLRGGVSSSALGEHLLWRITRSDSGYITRDDLPRGEADTPQTAARRYVIRKAVDRTLPQEIFIGLRRDLGLSAGDADAVMRGVALDAIARQPVRYLTSTLRMSVELFFGEDQQLGEVSKKDGDAHYVNPQARQRTWFEDRILHLGEPPSPAVENEFDRAEWLTAVYQPGRAIWLILIGYLLGSLATLVDGRARPGLLLALAVPPMLLANAALAGPEARFRYPLDPMIAVLAAGGLVWALHLLFSCARKRTSV